MKHCVLKSRNIIHTRHHILMVSQNVILMPTSILREVGRTESMAKWSLKKLSTKHPMRGRYGGGGLKFLTQNKKLISHPFLLTFFKCSSECWQGLKIYSLQDRSGKNLQINLTQIKKLAKCTVRFLITFLRYSSEVGKNRFMIKQKLVKYRIPCIPSHKRKTAGFSSSSALIAQY
jgi:hypothetical protein